MLQLYQAEWCRHSRKVRQRLTELGVDFVARQVAAEPDDREAMRDAVGDDEIPVLVRADGTILAGEEHILGWLDGAYPDAHDQHQQHRAKHSTKQASPAKTDAHRWGEGRTSGIDSRAASA